MGDFTTGGDIGGGTDIEAGTEEGSGAVRTVWLTGMATGAVFAGGLELDG